ncbi:MAG: hypothetical protein ABI970_06210 [Chloroflexota bacterium]
MSYLRLILSLALGLALLGIAMVVLALVMGHMLPYIGDLAYISTRDGTNKLYLMDLQRENSVRLSKTVVNDCCLTWSPDGQTLTTILDVSSDGSTDIYGLSMNSGIERLTNAQGADLYPSYSADGQRIVFTSYRGDVPKIFIMDADGSNQHALTTQSLANVNPHPVWSSDGQSVVLTDFNNVNSLFTIPANCPDPCSDNTQMTIHANDRSLMTTSFVLVDQTRMFMAAFDRRLKSGGYGMYTLDINSPNEPERLTVNANFEPPSVAVNGRWVAFVSGNVDPAQPLNKGNNLFILDGNCIGSTAGCATSVQEIASQIRTDDNLAWSPDGHWLVYVANLNGMPHLYLLDATCVQQHEDCTRYIHALPDTPARYVRPVWRPHMP